MSLGHRSRQASLTCNALLAALCVLAASCSPDGRTFIAKPGTKYDPDSGLPLEIISTADKAEMLLVKTGSFRRGDPAEVTRMTYVQAFYIDKFEVTNERYQRFVSARNWTPPSSTAEGAALLRWANGKFPKGRANYPVVLVSFEDAAAFAEWAGKKLPAQRQWEYAARGPEARQFPWGDSKPAPNECNTADRLAGRELPTSGAWQSWYTEWMKRKPEERNAAALAPVGSFPKDVSPFGCVDMGGNVREWCVKNTEDASIRPLQSESERGRDVASGSCAACGGSWLRPAAEAQPWRCDNLDSAPYYDVGFRCVISAGEPDIRKLAKPPATK